jgi:hypothetical protein
VFCDNSVGNIAICVFMQLFISRCFKNTETEFLIFSVACCSSSASTSVCSSKEKFADSTAVNTEQVGWESQVHGGELAGCSVRGNEIFAAVFQQGAETTCNSFLRR